LLLLLLMSWRSSKNQKKNIMNEPNSFLTILLMRLLTVALSIHTYGKSCIALIHPAAVQDPSPKKKKKLGAAWRRRKWAWGGDVTTMRSADGFVQFDWEQTHSCKTVVITGLFLSTIW
jgi:hypothetical protein